MSLSSKQILWIHFIDFNVNSWLRVTFIHVYIERHVNFGMVNEQEATVNPRKQRLLPWTPLQFLRVEEDVELPDSQDEGVADHHGVVALHPELVPLRILDRCVSVFGSK